MKKILLKKSWKKIILVTNRPFDKRVSYNLNKILGPGFTKKVITADFSYPKETLKKLEKVEKRKLWEAIKFFQGIKEGDDKTIYKLAMEDLERNYKRRK